MQQEIFLIPALSDNYIFILRDHSGNKTFVFDPAEAQPVLNLLNQKKWSLDFILNTHHHADHIGGNSELKRKTNSQIYCSRLDEKNILNHDHLIESELPLNFGSLNFKILSMMGHTLGHIAYYNSEMGVLFSGDVIFGLGCGRVFEGTFEQMKNCMDQIYSLPPETQIYCSHEYTERNLAFALSVDGDNPLLMARAAKIKELRQKNIPTVPLVLKEEINTNPFLRIYNTDFLKKHQFANSQEAFTELRKMRNNF